jgi:hypothetical protein
MMLAKVFGDYEFLKRAHLSAIPCRLVNTIDITSTAHSM